MYCIGAGMFDCLHIWCAQAPLSREVLHKRGTEPHALTSSHSWYAQGAISQEMLREYIAYARARIHPVITDAASAQLIAHYQRLRQMGRDRDVRCPAWRCMAGATCST
jgi:DNA replicative helicase MCM subunit Mcm2 (Cdc46/Mcm family)